MADDFPALHAAASRSRIVLAANAVVNVMTAAAGSSATGRWLKNRRDAVASLPASNRLRWSATTIGWAMILYWAGLAVMPPYTATGLPRAFFLALAVTAWLVAGNAQTVARAWPSSRVARMLRWLVT